ncbi:hypothetical protein ACYOEI_00370 [Singulisphaera rosea]
MELKFKPTEQKEDDTFDAGFKLPDTKSILERLEVAAKDELRREHKEEMEKEEKAGKKRQKRGGSVCCCEDPHCRIGPFIEKS